MKKTIIIDGRKFFYSDGKSRRQISELAMNQIYLAWKHAGAEIHRKKGMGKIEWIWIEGGSSPLFFYCFC